MNIIKYFMKSLSLAIVSCCISTHTYSVEQTGSQPETEKTAKEVESALYKEGVDYFDLGLPFVTGMNNKPLVTSHFAYSCGHCFRFERPLSAWLNGNKNIDFEKVPTIWSKNNFYYAALFYTIKNLELPESTHNDVFVEIIQNKNPLFKEESIRKFFADHGVDGESFVNEFRSFRVAAQANQAGGLTKGYKIASTPSMVVGGKYRVSIPKHGGYQSMLSVVDFILKEHEKGKM